MFGIIGSSHFIMSFYIKLQISIREIRIHIELKEKTQPLFLTLHTLPHGSSLHWQNWWGKRSQNTNFFGPYGRVKVSSAHGGAETSLQVSSVSPHTKEFHFWAKWPKGSCVCEMLSINCFIVEGCLSHLSHPMSIKPLGYLVTLTLHIGPKANFS